MAYPASKTTFSEPVGTTRVDTGIDHAALHKSVNDTLESLQDVLGTTPGTSVLQYFAQGDFPARINTSGVFQHPVQGTLNNSIQGSPTVTGGTFTGARFTTGTIVSSHVGGTANFAAGTLNNVVMGTPAITGGTFNTGVVGTPSIIGGTMSAPTITGGVSLSSNGSITQAGTADHITLTPGASKLVRVAVLRQDGTTNTYSNNQVVLSGWNYVDQGDGTVVSKDKAISFGVTFTEPPIMLTTIAGHKATGSGVPTNLNQNTVANGALTSAFIYSSGTTATTVRIYQSSALSTGHYYLFTWIAIGSLN